MDDMVINSFLHEPQNAAQNSSAVEQNIETQIFDSFDKIASMQKEWDDFIESVGGDIFLTYDWCRIWWKHYGAGRTLRIYVFRCGDKLAGILPTFIEKIHAGLITLKVARIVSTTHLLEEINPPVIEEHIGKITGQWLTNIYREFNPDIVCIGPISGTYNKTDRLADECGRSTDNRYIVENIEKDVQTIFHLGKGWDEYLSMLPAKTRHEINRNCRKIQKIGQETANSTVCRAIDGSELQDAFGEFVRMHNSYWQKYGKLGHFNDWPDSENFHREVADAQLKRGRLRFFKISSGQNCIEYDYAYNFSGTYFHMLNGRTTEPAYRNVNVGMVAFSEVAMKASDDGVGLINSMRGKYDYKLYLGGQLVPIHTILVYRNNLFTRLRVKSLRLFAKILNIYYYRIWYIRLAGRMPRRRRPLWKIWIRTNAFV